MFKIKRITIIALMAFLSSMAILNSMSYAYEVNGMKLTNDDTYTLKTGISMVEQVPKSFYGTWRVSAKLTETSSAKTFKPTSIDLWNLSRINDVINLSNPFTGASASITVSYVDTNVIKFSKKGDYDNKQLTDTVELKLSGNTFSGINRLSLETLSDVDNSVISIKTATYILKGEKISGTSVLGK